MFSSINAVVSCKEALFRCIKKKMFVFIFSSKGKHLPVIGSLDFLKNCLQAIKIHQVPMQHDVSTSFEDRKLITSPNKA